MKRILISLFLFSSAICAVFSQDIFPVGSKWNNLVAGYEPSIDLITVINETITVEKDTVIGELSYKKLSFFENGNADTKTPLGFFRVDEEKKLLFKTRADSSEKLIYNYAVELNDTVQVYSFIGFTDVTELWLSRLRVQEIDSTTIDGEKHKRIQLSTMETSDIVEVWIEGIGSLSGFLHNFTGFIDGPGYELLCFSKNNGLIYKNDRYSSCDYQVFSRDIDISNHINVWPNPVAEECLVSIKNYDHRLNYKLLVYNNQGELVLMQNIKTPKTTLCNEFGPGIYMIKVQNSKGILGALKVLMQ